jgi:hypothetical protein
MSARVLAAAGLALLVAGSTEAATPPALRDVPGAAIAGQGSACVCRDLRPRVCVSVWRG